MGALLTKYSIKNVLYCLQKYKFTIFKSVSPTCSLQVYYVIYTFRLNLTPLRGPQLCWTASKFNCKTNIASEIFCGNTITRYMPRKHFLWVCGAFKLRVESISPLWESLDTRPSRLCRKWIYSLSTLLIIPNVSCIDHRVSLKCDELRKLLRWYCL